uniref:Uncharacterized protein n=1 Tax=Arundo donax TaxID=35708 RepID=A0A0A8Z4Z9_ARUDO
MWATSSCHCDEHAAGRCLQTPGCSSDMYLDRYGSDHRGMYARLSMSLYSGTLVMSSERAGPAKNNGTATMGPSVELTSATGL